MNMFNNLLSFLLGLISPFTTILIGYLLTRIEDILFTLNVLPDGEVPSRRKAKIIRLIKLIGIFMMIGAGIRLLRTLFSQLMYFAQLIM